MRSNHRCEKLADHYGLGSEVVLKNENQPKNRSFWKTETENRTNLKKTDKNTDNRNRPEKSKLTQH